MKDKVKLTTLEQIKAYSDPYRLRILTLLRNRGDAATVKEIADELGEVPAKVHYHIKKLEKAGIVELIRTKEVKGIIAKYYYLTADRFEIVGENIGEQAKQIYKSEVLNLVSDYYQNSRTDVIGALSSRIEEHSDEFNISLTSRTLYLTKEEFDELNTITRELFAKYENKREGTISCHGFSVLCKMEDDKK
ncbi:ArsR/SmtB family transcription factor [Clostridium manihotivorum]|uniref:Transcriptional regulator n=1 Tax=Clostridium manihotivorum TaxID=2320868 RepID=A0A410DXZ9_9CLOT|nr:helix-turn-helix domain-containing protein [Clostridium manihotivorum]QAA34056.1 transcriptional regulator [Clostridium manihotivorum]